MIKIGDAFYTVENFNQYYDDGYDSYETKYGKKVVIKSLVVEGFIIDEEGIHIAEDSHDGWNRITTYHNLHLEKYGDCKIFFSFEDAMKFIESIRKE